ESDHHLQGRNSDSSNVFFLIKTLQTTSSDRAYKGEKKRSKDQTRSTVTDLLTPYLFVPEKTMV
ncbi:hypothetical protein J0J27_23160, partial [Vibrio vulnificus]|uniref:hypothetical protein n=1 Tax=Vibrio vulnificus TaxID=672 RepID=UPI0019D4AF69